MSEIKPPKVRVEIFRGPGFFDDSFAKGWSVITGGYQSSGDEVIVTGLNTPGRIEKSFSTLNRLTYPKLIVRVTKIIGENTRWGIKLWDGIGWNDIFTDQSGTGLFETTIWTPNANVSQIALLRENSGPASDQVFFEYVAICKATVLVPDLGDLAEEMTITSPILSRGISGAKFSIPNFNGAYNGLISNHDIVIIWLARDEANLAKPEYKAFGGRVVNPAKRGVQQGEFYVTLDCHGHGSELNIPPGLLQKLYSAVNGRTIIEDALALCSYFAKHPIAAYWFDKDGASGSTDDRINSTHDVMYDEVVPMNVITEILEKAKNPSAVQGFDAYDTPAGCLVGHLINSLDFTSEITSITPRTYVNNDDSLRVTNKRLVYGAAAAAIPANKDDYSDSLTNWTGDVMLYAGWKALGSYSICISTPGGGAASAYGKRTFGAVNVLFPKMPKSFDFMLRGHYCAKLTNIKISLLAPDEANYFFVNKQFSNPDAYFPAQEVSYRIGNDQEGSGDDNKWGKVGSPNWQNLQGWRFDLTFSESVISQGVDVDAIHFGTKRFSGLAEDAASQASYGIRCPEPIVEDSLQSDAECLARAQSIVAVEKDPVITIPDVIVDGDHRYKPSHRQRIVVSNDGLDAYFRIVEVKYKIQLAQWDAILILSNEPQLIDFVFKQMLERRS